MSVNVKSFRYEYDVETGVATITLDRPERLNALTFEAYAELRDTFAALDTEPGVRCVLLLAWKRLDLELSWSIVTCSKPMAVPALQQLLVAG